MTFFMTICVTSLISLNTAFGQNPEEQIGTYLKSTLNNMTQIEIIRQMELHFLTLNLLVTAQPRVWAHKIFVEHENELIPYDTNKESLENLIDQVVENAAKNPYLHEFLGTFDGPGLAKLQKDVQREGHWGIIIYKDNINVDEMLIPNVITYAAVLENLNKLQTRTWRFSEVCHIIWKNSYNILDLLKSITLFGTVKTLSIQDAVNNDIKILKKGIVDSSYGAIQVTLNIYEAVGEDIRAGNLDNAIAGKSLAKHKPGQSNDTRTQQGETRISEDGQKLEFRPPLPRQWNDLYSTWNLAFVTNTELTPAWPYFMVKLLIPSVSGYQEHPERYLYSRVASLYAHINHGINTEQSGGYPIDWSNKALTQSWGKVNKKSARDYENQISRSLHH